MKFTQEELDARVAEAVADKLAGNEDLISRLRDVEADLLDTRGLYEMMRSERDRLRRDLDAKDHEVATLKGEVNAARVPVRDQRYL